MKVLSFTIQKKKEQTNFLITVTFPYLVVLSPLPRHGSNDECSRKCLLQGWFSLRCHVDSQCLVKQCGYSVLIWEIPGQSPSASLPCISHFVGSYKTKFHGFCTSMPALKPSAIYMNLIEGFLLEMGFIIKQSDFS